MIVFARFIRGRRQQKTSGLRVRGTLQAAPLLAVAIVGLLGCSQTSTIEAEPSAGNSASAVETETSVATADETAEAETPEAESEPTALDQNTFPDVIGATATLDNDGSWSFAVTISSPYDSPERYADAWRVEGPDSEVYGVRELAHDHASEQPFTRSQSGIVIPVDVTEVTVVARDQLNGWGGQTTVVNLQ